MGAGIPPEAEDLCRNNRDDEADDDDDVEIPVGRRRKRPIREEFRRAESSMTSLLWRAVFYHSLLGSILGSTNNGTLNGQFT